MSKEAVIVDPGGQEQSIDRFIAQNGLKVLKIVNTHGHIDHVAKVTYFQKKYQVSFLMHALDIPLAEQAPKVAQMFRIPDVEAPQVDQTIREGDSFCVGAHVFKVIETPGHTPGGCSFYCQEQGILFVGDTLFRKSIGRVDLPGGNFTQIKHSIVEKLFKLPDDTIVYPGHMEPTTVGYERKHNPFFGEQRESES
jgi:glyoxylase-like metal-dependent hydrolase (beta-lactamase superfamily II)